MTETSKTLKNQYIGIWVDGENQYRTGTVYNVNESNGQKTGLVILNGRKIYASSDYGTSWSASENSIKN